MWEKNKSTLIPLHGAVGDSNPPPKVHIPSQIIPLHPRPHDHTANQPQHIIDCHHHHSYDDGRSS